MNPDGRWTAGRVYTLRTTPGAQPIGSSFFKRTRGKAPEGLVGRVNNEAGGFQGNGAQDGLSILRAKNENSRLQRDVRG